MFIHQPPSDKRILECLNESYGIPVHTLLPLPLGADLNTRVYKAESFNNSSFFVKLRRGHAHRVGVAILDLLLHAKSPLIIPPVTTKSGQAFAWIDDFFLILQPFIEGQNGFHQPLTEEQWATLGRSVKQIHEMEIPSAIQQQLRREEYSSKWRNSLRTMLDLMDENSPQDDIAQKLWAFMETHKTAILGLVDRAEELAEKIKNKFPDFVLCHSDMHAGNILIDNHGKLFLVDWDDPILAPRERDLMFIGGGVGNVWNQKNEETLFYQGYGDTKINPTLLAYYRCERIVEDMALYAEELLLKTTGGEDRALMYKHFTDMFEPRGVVEIAFETEYGKTSPIKLGLLAGKIKISEDFDADLPEEIMKDYQ